MDNYVYISALYISTYTLTYVCCFVCLHVDHVTNASRNICLFLYICTYLCAEVLIFLLYIFAIFTILYLCNLCNYNAVLIFNWYLFICS